MPDVASDPLRAHPLADEAVEGGFVHRAGGPLVALTPLVADLLVTAVRAGSRVVVRTADDARLTAPLAAALRDTRGVWLVVPASGDAWDGLTGSVLDPAAPLRGTAPRPAAAWAAGAEPEAVQVVLAASVRHRRDTEPRFGALLEAFAAGLGAPPRRYGPHEPVERAWDRAELTALLAHLPEAPRLLVAGAEDRPLTGSVRVGATRVGFEETVEATLALDLDAPVADRVVSAFTAGAADTFPLFGFVLAQPGRRDLTRAPVLPHAPAPLAVLVGAPGVRDLGIDVDLLVRRFDAVRLGRPRIPALLVPFGGRLEDWESVESLIRLLGPDRVTAAFGRPVPGGPTPPRR